MKFASQNSSNFFDDIFYTQTKSPNFSKLWMIKHMASFLPPNNFEFFHVNFTCLLKKLDDTLIDNPGMHFVYAHKNEIWNLFPIYCSNFHGDNLPDLKYTLKIVDEYLFADDFNVSIKLLEGLRKIVQKPAVNTNLEFVEAIFAKLLEPISLGKHRSAENDLNGMREAVTKTLGAISACLNSEIMQNLLVKVHGLIQESIESKDVKKM